MRERLVQGPNVARRVGFEPETIRTQGTELTTEQSRPTKQKSTSSNRATQIFLAEVQKFSFHECYGSDQMVQF